MRKKRKVIAISKPANYVFSLFSLSDVDVAASSDEKDMRQQHSMEIRSDLLLSNEGRHKARGKVVLTVGHQKSPSRCHD